MSDRVLRCASCGDEVDERVATLELRCAKCGGPRCTVPKFTRKARNPERLAWVRLLKADGAKAALASGDYSEAAAAEYDAALRGLQDLGVDVDDLLGERR